MRERAVVVSEGRVFPTSTGLKIGGDGMRKPAAWKPFIKAKFST